MVAVWFAGWRGGCEQVLQRGHQLLSLVLGFTSGPLASALVGATHKARTDGKFG